MNMKINPQELLGKKYNEVSYHCWHFIEECLEVPTLKDVAVATARNDIIHKKHLFKRIQEPTECCIATLGAKHVGIYMNGVIFHNEEGGVHADPIRKLKLLYRSIEYYDLY